MKLVENQPHKFGGGGAESMRAKLVKAEIGLKVTKAVRAKLEHRHWVRFWGQRRMCSPVFIEEILGDGGKLLAVQPLNTRPNYYLIRIDSSWNTSNYQEPCVGDNMDDIYDAIENAVGPSSWQDDNEKWHHDYWPALSDDSGSSWWDATDLIVKQPRIAKAGPTA